MNNILPNPEYLANSIIKYDRQALSEALNLLDDKRPIAQECAANFLDQLLSHKSYMMIGHLIGITGPPGAGKSSITATLIKFWRKYGLKVAVLAVDPSSPATGGALLGDRLRMHSVSIDDNVFIRSLACREEFGGLSIEVWPMSLVMLSVFDIVLIETVGVGQREIDVANMTDTTCFIAQPGSGDEIQFIKAGIIEVPHIIIVNKADMGLTATKTLNNLRMMIHKRDENGWSIKIIAASAKTGTGIETLVNILDQHRNILISNNILPVRRRKSQVYWLIKRLKEEFGSYGIKLLGGQDSLHKMLESKSSMYNYSPLYEYKLISSQIMQAMRVEQKVIERE